MNQAGNQWPAALAHQAKYYTSSRADVEPNLALKAGEQCIFASKVHACSKTHVQQAGWSDIEAAIQMLATHSLIRWAESM